MAVEFGVFHFDDQNKYPSVVIKDLGSDRVLVKVWTEQGDRVEAGTRASEPNNRTFVPDNAG